MHLFAGFSVVLLACTVFGQQQLLSKSTKKLAGILLKVMRLAGNIIWGINIILWHCNGCLLCYISFCFDPQATSEDRFNYVTSPFASSVILAIAAEGAQGETKSQLISTLGGELPDKDSYKEILTSIKVPAIYPLFEYKVRNCTLRETPLYHNGVHGLYWDRSTRIPFKSN